MANVYLTCPACRAKFNAEDAYPFAFCPFCSRRCETREYSEDEARKVYLRMAARCNRQCETTGYKCRCGCIVEVFKQDE